MARGDVCSDLVRVQRGVPVNKAAWSTRYTGVVALPKIDLMQPTLLARPFHRDGWIFEGYVAKDEASPYSGGRTLS